MRKLFYWGVALFVVVAIGSVFRFSVQKVMSTEEKNLKERIDSAQMKIYVEKEYGVRVPYPSFFDVDTSEMATARFFYSDESRGRILMLVMFVQPNVEGWTVKEAVENLSDSATTCQAIGKDYYIMYGSFGKPHHVTYFVEKCFLVADNWIDYTIFFKDETVAQRLIEMVVKWKP